VAGPAVFIERYEDAPGGTFDAEADERVCRLAREAGMLLGIDNLVDAETEFRVEPGSPWRENLFSSVTGSFARQRTVVCALSLALFGTPDAPLHSVARALRAGKRTLLAEAHTPLAQHLTAACGAEVVVRSEYFAADAARPESGDGVLHVDLQNIAFADESFAFVVTNGVMEHVPDAFVAEAEIVRVLAPGGTICFTIPFDATLEADNVLAERLGDGTVRHYRPPVYHHDPLRPQGALVYRQFAHQAMRERFERLGCSFDSYRLWSDTLGLIGPMQWIHLARKPA
jgi:SAM-dependent methyltransferase